jgi:hypothetical protein
MAVVDLSEFICPISQDTMSNPYIHSNCGRSFDYSNIITLISKGESRCPICRTIIIPQTNFIPNRTLKNIIDSMTASRSISTTRIPKEQIADTPKQFLKLDVLQTERTNLNAYIKISAPNSTVHLPLNLTLVIDSSGSMNEETTTKDAFGNTISNGFSRLDLVKFAINTIISSLNNGDIITIIKFNDIATPLIMNKIITRDDSDIDIETLNSKINSIIAGGGTNIWDGLLYAFKNIETTLNPSVLMNYSLILLTDGIPTINPVGGYIKALESIQKRHISKTGNCIIPSIHTLGFGYDINSELLFDIANYGNGTFNFIPDAGFVGTICINLMVNIQMTYINGSKLIIKYRNGDKDTIRLGPIQYHHPLSKIINITNSKSINIDKIFLHFNFMETIIDMGNPLFWNMIDAEIPYLYLRNYFLKYLDNAIKNSSKHFIDELKTYIQLFKDLYPTLKTEPYVKAILEECNGEISMALSPTFIGKWGMHYLRSLFMAHNFEWRNNFKDVAVQFYGGHPEFEDLRTRINDIFNSLPAPKPSLPKFGEDGLGVVYAKPISMSSYNTSSNGCFGCDTIIMATKDPKKIIPYPIPISQLQLGDWVLVDSQTQTFDKVIHITIHTNPNSFPVIKFTNELIITPYHPILYEGIWQFPIDILQNAAQPIGEIIDYTGDVYNIVLNEEAYVELYGWKCVSLGHGIFDDPVAYHEYLGSEEVISDIAELETDELGRTIITPNMVKRDPETNLIVKYSY